MKADLNHDALRRFILKAAGAAALTMHFSFLPQELMASGLKSSRSLKGNSNLENWIQIDERGLVTIFTGKVEFGQGIGTALVQIAADELDVAIEKINLIVPDTDISPDEGYTVGSQSVQLSGMAMRQVSAEVRRILLERAASIFQVPIDKLSVADGVISDGSQKITYGQLISIKGDVVGNYKQVTVAKKAADRKISGRSMGRLDIPCKVFAEGAYLHDMRLPGMLHARVVRPVSQGGRLIAVDITSVIKMPGVKKIIQDGSFLAVVAEREEQAIAAAENLSETAVWSELQDLPDQDSLKFFIMSHPETEREILVDMGQEEISTDTKTYEACYFRPYQAHAPVGPSIGVAHWDNGRLKVWSHTQGPYPLKREISSFLSLPEEKIRVIHKGGSGCYGHNPADDAALEAAIIACNMPGIPIRLQWMRQEEFKWEPYGSAMVMDVRASMNKDGSIENWNYNVHGFPHSSRPSGKGGSLLATRYVSGNRKVTPPRRIPSKTGGLDRNARPYYDFKRQKITKNFIEKSPLRTSALRSLGAYANVFAVESFMDELAHQTGQDPVRFRLRHLKDERAKAVIKKVAEMAEWQEEREASEHMAFGRGIAFSRYKNIGGYLAVCVALNVDSRNGQITVSDIYAAVDCGEIINPDGALNQIEGGLLQALSWTLYEEVNFEIHKIISEDWVTYPILTHDRVPKLHVHLVDMPDAPPLGAGEVAQGPLPAAVANALYQATGKRFRELPIIEQK